MTDRSSFVHRINAAVFMQNNICVSQFNRDTALELFRMSICPSSADLMQQRYFSMVNVSEHPDIQNRQFPGVYRCVLSSMCILYHTSSRKTSFKNPLIYDLRL